MKKTPPFTFYLLFYAAASFSMPFIILYFQELGFSGAQIGLLAGMAPLITVFGAPIWTGLADSKGKAQTDHEPDHPGVNFLCFHFSFSQDTHSHHPFSYPIFPVQLPDHFFCG